jgi:hypothetical protein
MTNTMTDQAALAAEVQRLRALVLDLGEAVTRLTAELGQLRARVASLEAPAQAQAERELADAMADLTTEEWRSMS